GRRLYRARHSVRESHPPAHHSLNAASRGSRRDPRPPPDRNRTQHHDVDRHHPVDWHCQKECHHDDRFRAASRTRRKIATHKNHLPIVPHAVPPHHDDHHGGHVR